jgi:hypothetical protein
VSEYEGWLCGRAAGGDQAAFERLIAGNERALRNVCASFARTDVDTEIGDLYQLVCERLWVVIRRGVYNPHLAFLPFASKVAGNALAEDRRFRRCPCRWAPVPPASLDYWREQNHDGEGVHWQAPSWYFGADPCLVVYQRESLVEAWRSLRAWHAAAVNRYLASDGVGEPRTMVDGFYHARRRVHQALGRPLQLG